MSRIRKSSSMKNYDSSTTCPERSNVMPVSNVALRLESGSVLSDRDFYRQVRGKAVSQLIEKMLGYSPATMSVPDQHRIRKSLAPHQWEQRHVHLTCKCGRIDFGPVTAAGGSIRWVYLSHPKPCRCKRDSTNSIARG